MKTIDRYILRQLITVTLLGVVSLTTLLMLGQIFKELQKLLVESGAPPSLVVEFILQVIPFSLTFSVPWGFLTAVLLVYGRMAADNELSSMRMAGLSLWRLSAPAIGLGIVLSGLCYYINIQIAPQGKQAMSDIVISAAMDNPKNLLGLTQNAVKIDQAQIYIESRDGDLMKGVHIYPVWAEGNAKAQFDFSSMHAEEAIVSEFDAQNRILHFTLKNATIEHKDDIKTSSMPLIRSMPLQIHIPLSNSRRLKANRYTNQEIAQVLEEHELAQMIDAESMRQWASAQKKSPAFPAAGKLWADALKEVQHYGEGMSKKLELSFRTEPAKRASFACACLIFSLIGVPLAITARRKDTSTGFALGILVAALYFLALVLCEISRKSSGIAPYIILWLPNMIGAGYAIFLHHRAKYRG